MSTVDVNFVTWPNHPKRWNYFWRTAQAILERLTASRHEIRFHCSAEAQRDPRHNWYGDHLSRFCSSAGIELQWRYSPANLGANMNAALRMGSSPTILLVQDDWLLVRDLDLSPGIELLESLGLDILRYSWPDVDGMRPDFHCNSDGCRRIDLAGRWPYGDDPHLRRRDFSDRWGWYLEGGGHGSASADLMGRLIAGGAEIGVPDDRPFPYPYFRHIGDVTAVLDDKRNRRITRDD